MGFDRVRLKGQLIRNNILQYEFARKLAITESHLSRILKGRVRPSRDLVTKMSEILKQK